MNSLRAGVEGSLRRLRTDHIDLYDLHWPARNQPMFGQWQFEPARECAATPIGATNLLQLAENLAALAVELPPEVLSAIDAIHLRYTNPAP